MTREGRAGSLRVRLFAAFALVSVAALVAFVVAESLGVEAGLDATRPDEEAASERAHAFLYRWGLFSVLVALGVAAAIAGWLVVNITRPLDRLRSTAEAFAAGDRTARAEGNSGIRELDELAESFDTMADGVVASEQARSDLLRDVAHELRNPLTVVQGRLEEMREGLVPADAETLGAVHDECLRLSRVAADLAEIARDPIGEARPGPLQKEVLDLSEAVRSAAVVRSAEFARVDVDVELALVPVEVCADRDRLSQAIGNVLDNCVRYCTAGGSVVVRVVRAGLHVMVTVDDSGPGMTTEERSHACDRSYRGSRAVGVPGSGLGLAVARHWVVAHDGVMSIEESDLGGTRVRLVLPARQLAETGPSFV